MQEESLLTPKEPSLVDRHVGSLLKARRLQTGLSQTEVAGKLGITFQQLQKYESGANRISAGRLWTISEVLGVGMDYFFQADTAKSAESELFIQRFLDDDDAVSLVKNFQRIEDVSLRNIVSKLVLELCNYRTYASYTSLDNGE